MSDYQDTTIAEALKALTRPAPGSEWDKRIRQVPSPTPTRRSLRGSFDKATDPRRWKDRTLVKAAAGLYVLGVLTPTYVHHFAPEKQASAAPTATLTAAVPKSPGLWA